MTPEKTKMKARVKKLWLKALRSGKYRQARASLRKGRSPNAVSYCCVGVLCELAKREGVISKYNGNEGFPPEIVTTWAGLDSDDPRLGRSWRETASRLNDGGRDFNFIADRIERYL